MIRAARPPLAARVLVHGAVYLAAATMLAPLLWMVATSLKTDREAIGAAVTLLPGGSPAEWQWGNYLRAWNEAGLGRFYLNSTIVAVVVTVLSVAHNALAAFAFAKLRFTGRRVTFAVVVSTMLLPLQVSFIFMYLVCGWLGELDHLQALIVPFLASAFGIFYLRQAMAAVPDSLLDAGRLDGFTDVDLLLHVVAPSVRPALGALAIFTFMASWNSFFWPLIAIDSEPHFTLPLAVARLSTGYFVSSWPVQMAAAAIITLPTIAVFLVFQRSFMRGLAAGGGAAPAVRRRT